MSTFLIAEDEKPLAKALKHALASRGHMVYVAENGAKVFELLKQHRPNVILLDLIMPDMDGFEVLKILREMKATIPVIVNSNLTQLEDRTKVLQLGAVAYISKADASLAEIITLLEQTAVSQNPAILPNITTNQAEPEVCNPNFPRPTLITEDV